MRINHNISALKANNQLGRTNSALDKSLEKLSSGYRINRAADDAAGMAISQKMKTQIAGLDQASRNASDGISVIQTAEGALTEVGTMLQRMRELSVQASNGTNTLEDRESIQAEIDQLRDEIQRISDTTEFNTKTLLNGNMDQKSYSNNSSVNLISMSDTVADANYDIKITKDARQAVLVGTKSVSNNLVIDSTLEGKININGVDVEIVSGDTLSDVYEKIRTACDNTNINVFATADNTTHAVKPYDTAGYTAANMGDILSGSSTDTYSLVFVTNGYGSKNTLDIYCNNSALATKLGLSAHSNAVGVDAKAEITTGFGSTATVTTNGNLVKITDANDFEMIFEVKPGTAGTVFTDAKTDGTASNGGTGGTPEDVTVTVLDAGPMELQIGANKGQTMDVRIPKVNPQTLGIDSINLCTEEGAQEAISLLDEAITSVTAIRAKLGAYQNRLEHSISNLDVASENMSEALSRIEDVDMAEEMANYTQKNVLAQAGTSMLAQANERPQTILSLLQG